MCNDSRGETGGEAKEGCAVNKGVHCTPPPYKHTTLDGENENPLDKGNEEYAKTYVPQKTREVGKGGKKTAHLHTPSSQRVEEANALHSAHPLHTPPELKPLLKSRPDWITIQARKCVEAGAPGRLLEPLAHSVAHNHLGAGWRWQEALPFVREPLAVLASHNTFGKETRWGDR